MRSNDFSLLFFSIVFVIFVLVSSILGVQYFDHQKNFEEVFITAQEQNDASLCDSVVGDNHAITCFKYFVRKGFKSCSNLEKEVHCLTALGIITKDEDVCILPEMRAQLEFKNLCMAEIQVEKYEK